MRNVRIAIGALGLVVVLSSGCATNRGIIDVRVPPSENTEGGKVVYITKVADCRKFELRPQEASVPSLKDGQINNRLITSRAIARKRNGYGKALGDILLPEGRTVEDLVRESVQKALRDKGYSVPDATEAAGQNAIALEVDIRQFWAWFTPGFWAVKLQFEAVIDIKSTIMINGRAETVRGHVLLHSQAATGKAWSNTIQKGLEELIARIEEKTRTP